MKLTVLDADQGDIYRDIARIPLAYRNGIKEGTICRVRCNGKSWFLALRGSPRHTDATIKIDDKTRDELEVNKGREYNFEFDPLNFFMRYYATWYASDPFARVAYQMSLISLGLGVISLLLALIALPWVSWLCSPK